MRYCNPMISFKLISPEGEIVKGTNLSKFCAERGLRYEPIQKLLMGKYGSVKGWKTFTKSGKVLTKQSQEAVKRESQKFYNVETGEISTLGLSQLQFADKHGLQPTCVNQLINGHRICYKGWVTEKVYDLIYRSKLEI